MLRSVQSGRYATELTIRSVLWTIASWAPIYPQPILLRSTSPLTHLTSLFFVDLLYLLIWYKPKKKLPAENYKKP